MLARIALFSPPYSTLTYTLPEEFPEEFWLPGLRVAVPLGGKAGSPGSLRAGMLLARTDDDELPQGVVCKPVAWPLESAPIVPPDLLALALDLALRQGLSAGQTLGHMLPQGLRSTRVRLRLLDDTARGGRTLGLREAAFASAEDSAKCWSTCWNTAASADAICCRLWDGRRLPRWQACLPPGMWLCSMTTAWKRRPVLLCCRPRPRPIP